MKVKTVFNIIKVTPLTICLSAFTTFLYTTTISIRKIIFTACIVGIISFFDIYFLHKNKDFEISVPRSNKIILVTFTIDVIFSVLFYLQWMMSSKIGRLSKIIGVSKSVIVLMGAFTLGVCSFIFIYATIDIIIFTIDYKYNENTLANEKISYNKTIIVCLLSAIVAITICSQSSFIYPFNEWVDANCFFTVGKSIMNGLVPYRDLFEQKGPLLYFLHAITWMISKDTFIGVYFLEIAAAFFYLYYSFLLFYLLTKQIYYSIIPIIAVITYTAPAFKMGDSAEELCLCLLVYTVYVGAKSIINKQNISLIEYLIVGITSGCVFWIKFTLIGMYIGWFIAISMILLKENNYKYIFKSIVFIFLGIVISTIPYVIYFGLNNAIFDWLKVYIYDNIFLYSVGKSSSLIFSLLTNLFYGAQFVFSSNILLFMLCLLGLFDNNKVNKFLLSIELFSFIFVYAGGQFHEYYPFIFFIFVPFGLAVIYKFLFGILCDLNHFNFNNNNVIMISIVLTVVLCFILTPNQRLIGVRRDKLPQYQFNEIISTKENATLLNYGFLDGGFYTVSNIVPTCKAFCKLNIPLSYIMELQDYYVENKMVDFVVTRNKILSSENYDCVKEMEYYHEGSVRIYRLYEKTE